MDDTDDLRILVVDDHERWQQVLQATFAQLGGRVKIDIAPNYDSALAFITDHAYDLATIDLALLIDADEPQDSDELGLQLLRELRRSLYNSDSCGLLVLTGYATTVRVRQALKDYAVYDVIDKIEFDEQLFLTSALAAIRSTRLERARMRASARYRLTITLGRDQLISSELAGPARQASYAVQRPVSFDLDDLIRRGNLLNILVLRASSDPEIWRHEAHSLGDALYKLLAEDRGILSDLSSARALANNLSDLSIQFSGPSESLGLPFELLRDNNDYLGLQHLLTRRLVIAGGSISRKTDPFYAFVEGLLRKGETLRILVIGANCDGSIPAAEEEASLLVAAIRTDLDQLGIRHEVAPLIGAAATFQAVTRALRSGRYHMVHYAGHGRSSDTLPEIGGLVLRDDTGLITLTASDLNLLARDTDLHLVYLSCCLSARSANQTGRGEFNGVLEALARADVPVVLGYRWTVVDAPARDLARRFYRELWRSFSPGEALLKARRAAPMGKKGRDDETWAAPVLLAQNEHNRV